MPAEAASASLTDSQCEPPTSPTPTPSSAETPRAASPGRISHEALTTTRRPEGSASAASATDPATGAKRSSPAAAQRAAWLLPPAPPRSLSVGACQKQGIIGCSLLSAITGAPATSNRERQPVASLTTTTMPPGPETSTDADPGSCLRASGPAPGERLGQPTGRPPQMASGSGSWNETTSWPLAAQLVSLARSTRRSSTSSPSGATASAKEMGTATVASPPGGISGTSSARHPPASGSPSARHIHSNSKPALPTKSCRLRTRTAARATPPASSASASEIRHGAMQWAISRHAGCGDRSGPTMPFMQNCASWGASPKSPP
mmetsp:Transcript_6900/g.16643  ORF Transcript_6900/g.16643 Transcript_6900/m.16643 type:complete len:319 (+) Transcript_6900:737-1693(+)